LIELQFQIDNDDFGEEITLKPYPKYVYQTAKKWPKITEKETFLKTINRDILDHIYDLYLLKKKGYCFFCSKQSNIYSQKEKDSKTFLYKKVF
jgi:hypothetical protein